MSVEALWTESDHVKAEILCVGTEILLGDIVNTNAQFIARQIAAIGIGSYNQSVVGDNPQRLKDSLRVAFSRADIVIMTGGLGPTYDDLTKETAAELFGRGMVMHEPSLGRIEAFFKKIGREMTENNKKQAMMPDGEGVEVFENHNGTAPGLAVRGLLSGEPELGIKTAILLPGPPMEMAPMFTESVVPYLAKFSDKVFVSHEMNLFGIGESAAESALVDVMRSMTNPTIAPYAKEGEVVLRVTASAETYEKADEMTKLGMNIVYERLGKYVYGVDIKSLQNALVKSLGERRLTVATAESCTGGLIAKRITEIPGASEVFGMGAVCYANSIKTRVLGVSAETLERFGAVSHQTAREMAEGVRRVSGADIAVSTTGIAGPGGGTQEKPVGLVYIGVSTRNGCETYELHLARGYSSDREMIRWLAASNAIYKAIKAAEQL